MLRMMKDLDVEPNRVAYVGDSGSDMVVAVNAGAVAVGVSWGYRPASQLWESGATIVIDTPLDLLKL